MKNQSRKNRLIFNGIYGSLSWVLPLILAFVATPVIVRGLGNENYGIYALVLGFIGYSFNLGIGRAVTKYVAEYRAEEKYKEAGEVLTATFYLTFALAFIANLLIIIFAKTIVRDILLIAPERQVVAIYALYISGGTIFVLLISQIYQSLIQAAHRFDRLALVININGILAAAGNILLVWLGFGVLTLIWWFLLITIVSCLLFFFSSKKFLPEIKASFKFKSDSLKLIGKFGLGIFGYQIFGNIILIFERGWIIRSFGEESLTFYVVPMSLGIYILGFTISLVQVLFPVIIEMQNDRENIIKLYQKSTKIILTMICFVVLSMICGGKLLLSLWISPEFALESYQILVFHSLTFGTIAVLTISWQLTEGFGYPKINAAISFFWLAVTIPAMIFLAKDWGENGIAFARFLGVILSVPTVFYVEKRFMGNVQYMFWLRLILTLTVAVVAAYLTESWIFGALDVKWTTLMLGGIGGGIVFLICLLVLGFVTDDEKMLIKDLIKGNS